MTGFPEFITDIHHRPTKHPWHIQIIQEMIPNQNEMKTDCAL